MQSELKPNVATAANSWEAYWKGTGDIGAYTSGGASHPGILEFWDDFFRSVNRRGDSLAMIDLAAGNGAVIEGAFAVFEGESIAVSCIDISSAAIANIKTRFPSVSGLVASAASIPLASGAYDIVTSQFGIEYAGIDAVQEAARLVAGGGWLAFLMHNRGGAIHAESEINQKAIEQVKESQFIPLAISMFQAGFDAVQGAERAPYDEAAGQLAPAVKKLELVMTQYGHGVADGTVAQLYRDVGRIHNRIQYYDPSEVLSWLTRMNDELDSYMGRMASMRASAIDWEVFLRMCERLESGGFAINTKGPLLTADSELPLAWAMIAYRPMHP